MSDEYQIMSYGTKPLTFREKRAKLKAAKQLKKSMLEVSKNAVQKSKERP